MAFWQKKKRFNALLIDVGSASVAGAYLHADDTSAPIICYTLRLDIEPHEAEPLGAAMLRTLEALCTQLVKEGAPALRRETGSGHVDHILVSVAAPWQDTKVTVETVQKDRAFPFTHALLADAVAKVAKPGPDRIDSGHGVIATLLNGYDIQNPYGKHVKRADMVILASSLDGDVTRGIERIVRKATHTHDITFTAFAPAAYSIFKEVYPHEKDFLILDVSRDRIDLALVNHGYLVDAGTLLQGTEALMKAGLAAERMAAPTTRGMHQFIDPERNARFGSEVALREKTWVEGVRSMLADISSKHALPRTIFLLAEDDARGYLKSLLDAPELHTLWLSDESLGIVPVSPLQFASLVQNRAEADGDIFLSILALYYKRTFTEAG